MRRQPLALSLPQRSWSRFEFSENWPTGHCETLGGAGLSGNGVNEELRTRCYTSTVLTMGSVLELVPATRVGVKYAGDASRSERHFLDFVVDSESLWEKVGKPKDSVSIICFEFSREETIKDVNRLLLIEKAAIPEDRRSLFICGECGGFECGAVTASVVRDGKSVVWKDFGFENSYEENIHLGEYKGIGPYSFDWTPYERTLLQAIDAV